jgi:hypothetical protein
MKRSPPGKFLGLQLHLGKQAGAIKDLPESSMGRGSKVSLYFHWEAEKN